MKWTFSLLLALYVSFSLIYAQPAQRLADTPPERHAEAYLKAFNSTNTELMRNFFAQHIAEGSLANIPLEERLSRFAQMKQRLGSLQLKNVLDATPQSVTLVASTGDGSLVQLTFECETVPPFGLLGFRVEDVENAVQEAPSPGKALSEEELVKATRHLLDSLANADVFSGAVLIARHGKSLFEQAYGFADRDKKRANRVDTRFNLGSINKRFTKTAMYQLAAQGKLDFNDPIKKFLPDYPNKEAAEKVTIQHLLTMRSGIGDFFGDRYFDTPKERIRSINDYLPLFADKPLEFEPGSRNRYSNGGYIVLGAIIEKVSGTDYYSFVEDNIFKPAGMLDTKWFEKDKEVPIRALGYTRDGRSDSWVSNYSTLPARGSSAGGGYSTVRDLLRFIIALEKGIIPAPDTEQGLGIAGGAPGMSAALEWEPKPGYVIVVLANLDPPAAERIARQIRSWILN